ncbi:MAG: hypothetical protein A3H02_01945 [Candidatus Niyogibacteria bacterium RIFCSPLOWO2_12_FULL_41_13]|uniref:Uncharacterized protein n=1 Tax=Candidatus Niyogibacteria bacterium RIFCSPLOWO2_12_FULL_41_13 TaxID=1801726 RepID=A0A1G2F135_9BACT|nr:MAG: hypothetical protein A3H02_01945 [Candidatus Niyogibacteria bacterium RIFCSPLOWO2_12_FULL_41_13]
MTIITVPKELAKNKELVAVPRGTYEEFLSWQKKIKSAKTFKPTVAEKRALKRARKNYAQGRYISFEELKHELGFDN